MEPEPQDAAATAANPLAGWVSCARCSRRARRGQPYCEQCGLELFAPETAPAPAPRRSVTCTQCGASVAFPEGERTATCPFCDTPYVAQGELTPERFTPEFVLPFGVTQAQAQESFEAWLLGSRLFAPGNLRLQARLEAPRGVYLPFWSFSTRSRSRWSANIGEHWYQTQTYTTVVNGRAVTRTRRVQHTEWYPLQGTFQQYHAHYLVSGSKGLSQEIADALKPFPVAEVLRYQPQYLAGWLAEEYSVNREEAARLSDAVFAADERRAVAAFLPGDTQAELNVQTTFSETTEDLLFLPIWILAFRYRERLFRCVINGATGKQWGERPRSVPRIAIAVLLGIALAVLAFLWLSGRLGR